MEYRSLGKSGIKVSVIGFGCGGHAGLMTSDNDELQLETLKRAIDAGVNYFDTASVYGDGASETNLGRALRVLDASAVVSTKVNLQHSDLRHPADAVQRQLEASLSRLGMNRVDIVVLHNRVFERGDGSSFGVGAKLGIADVLGPNGVAEGFSRLAAAGTITVGAFTAFGGDPTAISHLIDSGAFGAVNASVNLVNPSAALAVPSSFAEANYSEVVSRAHDAGMGVMAIQVLARGVLTGAGPRSGRAARVARAALSYDSSLSSIATRFVLSQRGVSTAIMGFSQPEHVDEAVAAAAKGNLSPDIKRALDDLAVA